MARVCCAVACFGAQHEGVLDKLQGFADALAAGVPNEVAVARFERPEEQQAAVRLVDEVRALATGSSVTLCLEPLVVSLLVGGQYRPAIEFGNRGRLPLDDLSNLDRARLADAMATLLRHLGGAEVVALTID